MTPVEMPFNVGLVILTLGLMLAVAVLITKRRAAPTIGVLLGTFVMMVVLDPRIVQRLGEQLGEDPSRINPEPDLSVEPSAPAESTSPETPVETPLEPGADRFDFSWDIALWVLLALFAVVVLAIVIPLVVARFQSVARKQKEAREAAEALAKKRQGDQRAWAQLQAETKELGDRLMAYRRDMDAILKMPLIVDDRDPLTAAAVHAMTLCRFTAREECPTLEMHQQVGATDFASKVHAFRTALVRAEQNASRVGISRLSAQERKAMRRAQQLWAIASNPGATDHERARAAEQLKSVQKIVPLPQEALLAIEEKERFALPVGAGL